MNILGQALLWSGFLGASLATVWYDGPLTESKWSSVPWPYYLGSMVLGILGVVLLRAHAAAHRESSHRVEAEFSTLTESLLKLLDGVGQLRDLCPSIPPRDVVQYIDDQLAEPFADFADSRNALIQRFGLQGFADVMTQFASAERFVNRAWSASADGYRDEAVASLNRAERHLQRADALMNELNRENPPVSELLGQG